MFINKFETTLNCIHNAKINESNNKHDRGNISSKTQFP